MQHLEVSGAVRHIYIYIYVIRRLKVKFKLDIMHYSVLLQGWVQNFPASHTKAAPNEKCCEGYTAPSVVRLMYQYQYVLK